MLELQLSRGADGVFQPLDASGSVPEGLTSRNGWWAKDGFHAWSGKLIPGELLVSMDSGSGLLWPVERNGHIARARVYLGDHTGANLFQHKLELILNDSGLRLRGAIQPWPLTRHGLALWQSMLQQGTWDPAARCEGRNDSQRVLRLPHLAEPLAWNLRMVVSAPTLRQPLRAEPWCEMRFQVRDVPPDAKRRWHGTALSMDGLQSRSFRLGDETLRLGWHHGPAWIFLESGGGADSTASGLIELEEPALLTPTARRETVVVAVDQDGHGACANVPGETLRFFEPTNVGHAEIGTKHQARFVGMSRLVDETSVAELDVALQALEAVKLSGLPRLELRVFPDHVVNGTTGGRLQAQKVAEGLGMDIHWRDSPLRGGRNRWPELPLEPRRVARGAAAFALARAPAVPLVLSVLADLRGDALSVAAVLTGTAGQYSDAPGLVALDRWELGIDALARHLRSTVPALAKSHVGETALADPKRLIALLMAPPDAVTPLATSIRAAAAAFGSVCAELIARFAASALAQPGPLASWLEGDMTAHAVNDSVTRAVRLLRAPVTTVIQVGFSGWGWQPWGPDSGVAALPGLLHGRELTTHLRRVIGERAASLLHKPREFLSVEISGGMVSDRSSHGMQDQHSYSPDWPLLALLSDLGPAALLQGAHWRSANLVPMTSNKVELPWHFVDGGGMAKMRRESVLIAGRKFDFGTSTLRPMETTAAALIAAHDVQALRVLLNATPL